MEIKIKNLYRTCLDERAFEKLIKRYCKKFKYDILIVFDLRIRDYGNYNFDATKSRHIVKISPNSCGFSDDGVKLDFGAEKYLLIATLLHELRHASQYEKMGRNKFWNEKFGCTNEIQHPSSNEYFSLCEVDARAFENKHILSAVKYYNDCVPEDVVI